MDVDALLSDVAQKAQPLVLVAVLSEMLDRAEREHLSCSYSASQAMYVWNKLEARRVRLQYEETGWGYCRTESQMIDLIDTLLSRVRLLRYKRYQNVCRQCPFCETRRKSWPAYTKFKALSPF